MIKWIKQKLNNAWNWTKRNVKKVLIGIGILGVVSAAGIIEYDLSHITGLEMVDKFSNAPQEIRNKYVLEEASFKATPKDNRRDRIQVKIGGKDEFIPKVEIQRWDNEVSLSVELLDTETGNPTLNFESDKIKWSKGNIDIEYYDYEEGYKMVWFLKEKPLTNKVEFTLQSKDVVFYYQPELTQEEIDDGMERPENVVGSYAVYHKTKGGMNNINGMDYKIGKIGHIYRPRLYDSNDWEVWGDLHIENGKYEVTIPQDFYNNAVYPIRSNDTFGYTGEGASVGNFAYYSAPTYYSTRTGEANTATEDGTISDINIFVRTSMTSATNGVTTLSVNEKDSEGANSHGFLGSGEATISYPIDANKDWRQIAGLSIGIVDGHTYILNGVANAENLTGAKALNLKLDVTTSEGYYFENFTSTVPATAYANSKEDPWTDTSGGTTRRYSIYANYSTAAERRIIIID